MAKGQASVTVTVDDLASAVLKKINTGIKQVNASSNQLSKSAKSVSDGGALGTLRDGLRGVRESASKVTNALTSVAPALGVITGAASIAGLVALTNAFAALGAQTGRDAQRIGITVGSLSKLENAAQLAGASAGAATSGIETLKENLNNARFGRAPELANVLTKLGVPFNSAAFQAKTAAQQFEYFGDIIKRLPNRQTQLAVATQLFGGAARDLLPVLLASKEELQGYLAEAARHGPLTEEQAQAAKKLENAQRGLGQSVDGLRNEVVAGLSPALGDLYTWLSRLIDENRVWIGQEAGKYAKEIVTGIKDAPWGQIITDVKGFGSGVNDVVQSLGGWKTAGELLIGLWIGAKAVQMISNLTAIATLMRSFNAPSMIALLAFLGYKAAKSAGEETAREGEAGRVPTGVDPITGNPTGYRDQTPEERARDAVRPMGFMNWLRTQLPGAYRGNTGGPTSAQGGSFDQKAGGVVTDLMRDLNLTREQASGIVGGLGHESGLQAINERNPVVPGSRGGWGWAQWTADRRRLFENWAKANNADITTDDANQRFLKWELQNTNYGLSTLSRLRQARTVEEASTAFTPFETGRPVGTPGEADEALPSRQRHARRAYELSQRPERQPPPAIDLSPATNRTLAPAPSAAANNNGQVTVTLGGTLPNGVTANTKADGVTFNNSLAQAPAFQFSGF